MYVTSTSWRVGDPKALRGIVAKLHYAVTGPQAPFEVDDGTVETMRESGGVTYKVRKTGTPSKWFHESLYAVSRITRAKRRGEPAPHCLTYSLLPLIHWPTLLSQARFGRTEQSVLRPIAHELLGALAPLIQQFDEVLFQDIRRMQFNIAKNAERMRVDPLYFGQDDGAVKERFDAHVSTLMEHQRFPKYLHRTMSESLDLIIAKHDTQELPLCTNTRDQHKADKRIKHHRKGESCEFCVGKRWTRDVHLLWPDRMRDSEFAPRITLKLFKPKIYAEFTDPWYTEIRYILSGVSPTDGATRIVPKNGRGEHVLVNFEKLVNDAKLYRPESRLARVTSEIREERWAAGYRARVAFEAWLKTEVRARRDRDLLEYVKDAGWDWYETTATPYELYSVEALLRRHEVHKRKLRYLHQIDESKRRRMNHSPSAPRIAFLTFKDREGIEYGTSLVQRNRDDRLINYFTIPYLLETPELEKAALRGRTVNVGSSLFWSAHAINGHAELKRDGKLVYPDLVRDFAQFVAGIDQHITPTIFKQYLREATYSKRVAEKFRDERSSLGPFAELEDETIRTFFLSREKERMTQADWTTLLDQLPGRSQRAVQRRLEELGKQYAKAHGWVAYVQSPMCLRNDATRRKRWLSEGVPL